MFEEAPGSPAGPENEQGQPAQEKSAMEQVLERRAELKVNEESEGRDLEHKKKLFVKLEEIVRERTDLGVLKRNRATEGLSEEGIRNAREEDKKMTELSSESLRLSREIGIEGLDEKIKEQAKQGQVVDIERLLKYGG